MRIGFGYDVHAFCAERPLILGGIEIPFEVGLKGHSDADVLIHAIIDAMIGACALGTIGEHFPDTDPKYKNIDSKILLNETNKLIQNEGYKIVNIDSIIVTQKPRLMPYLEKMRKKIAGILKTDVKNISIKAKCEEGLGFTGRLEGIKAYATVLIE